MTALDWRFCLPGCNDLDHGITEGTESRNFRDSMLSVLPCSRAVWLQNRGGDAPP